MIGLAIFRFFVSGGREHAYRTHQNAMAVLGIMIAPPIRRAKIGDVCSNSFSIFVFLENCILQKLYLRNK